MMEKTAIENHASSMPMIAAQFYGLRKLMKRYPSNESIERDYNKTLDFVAQYYSVYSVGLKKHDILRIAKQSPDALWFHVNMTNAVNEKHRAMATTPLEPMEGELIRRFVQEASVDE